ncbi:MAG: hypothetical protein L0L60_07665, partial [Tetragenococcus halophilus]|nr:hypothetical protein [Tetragenococcus halophilus]
LAEDGHPEFVIPTDPSKQSDAMKLLAIASNRIQGRDNNKRPDQMRMPNNAGNDSGMIKEFINLMKENTELLRAIKEKEMDVYMESAVVGKMVADPVSKEISKNEYMTNRKNGRLR